MSQHPPQGVFAQGLRDGRRAPEKPWRLGLFQLIPTLPRGNAYLRKQSALLMDSQEKRVGLWFDELA